MPRARSALGVSAKRMVVSAAFHAHEGSEGEGSSQSGSVQLESRANKKARLAKKAAAAKRSSIRKQYSKKTLQSKLGALGLPKSGNLEELVQRYKGAMRNFRAMMKDKSEFEFEEEEDEDEEEEDGEEGNEEEEEEEPAPAAPAEDPVLQTFIRAKAKADAKSAICAAGSARLAAIAAASGAGEAGQQALAEMEAELAALN